MPSFPTLSTCGGAATNYPFSRSLVCPVGIAAFSNGKEKRWKRAAPYWKMQTALVGLSDADVTDVLQFFIDNKGRYGTGWDIAIAGKTYANCTFDQDELMFRVDPQSPLRRSCSFVIRQTIKDSGTPTGSGTTYPTFTNGITTQMPYQGGVTFATIHDDMDHGTRYSFYTRSELHKWELNYPAFSESESDDLVNFFLRMHGPLTAFSLTDPNDATVYANCRFSSEELVVRYEDFGRVSVSVTIEEFVP